jgi:hypothetical protein
MLTGAQSRVIAKLCERVKQAQDDAGIEIPSFHLQLFEGGVPNLKPLLKSWRPAQGQKIQGE